uniref:Uncharacterized protein n=1 Tax=Opuntia streptacantha TaxID=393608 RepID=A0A7C8YIL5_OPUST
MSIVILWQRMHLMLLWMKKIGRLRSFQSNMQLNGKGGLKIFEIGVSRGSSGGATGYLPGMSLWRLMSGRSWMLIKTIGWLVEVRKRHKQRLASGFQGRNFR